MKKIAFLIFFIFFGFSLYLLPHYGPTWDEPVHFYRGEAYLHYFLTGEKDYKKIPPVPRYYQKDDNLLFNPVGVEKDSIFRRSMFMDNQITYNYFIKNDSGHPPLSDIFASFFNFVLFQKLGLINDVDSFHVYSIFLAALLVSVIFLWTSKYYGKVAGLVAAFSLSAYPMFWAEAHFNTKDIPQTVFYSFAIIAFYEGITNRKNKWLLISSVFCGFAFATKFNAIFLPFTLIPWAIVYIYPRIKSLKEYISIIPSIVAYPFIPFIIFFACWPFLWGNPVGNFLSIVNYYQGIGNNTGFDQRYITLFGINTYAIQWIIFITPIILLILSFIGIIYFLIKGKKEKNKFLLLIFLWLLIPIIRVTRPDSGIYGGVRQIMEYIPAIAIFSGIGSRIIYDQFISKFKFIKKRYISMIFSLIIVISFAPLVFRLVNIHPNEDMYFNSIIGGLNGAVRVNLLDWGNSLGTQYRSGIKWINQNAEQNAKLTIDVGLGSNIPENLLREDIKFSVIYRSAQLKKGEYLIGLANSGYDDVYLERYLNNFLIPVHQEKLDGIPILTIWKNDIEHTRENYKNEVLIKEDPYHYITGNTLFIDFGEIYNPTKIAIEFDKNCIKDPDGSIQISKDAQSWITLENSLSSQFLLPFPAYIGENQYILYLVESGRYMEFNFTSDNSCFKSVRNIKVYGFN